MYIYSAKINQYLFGEINIRYNDGWFKSILKRRTLTHTHAQRERESAQERGRAKERARDDGDFSSKCMVVYNQIVERV